MAKMLDTPDFKSEKEEADWWFNNQDLVLKEFKEAAADGTLIRRSPASTAQSVPASTTPLTPEQKPNNAA